MEQVRIVISADAQRVQQAVRQANASLQQMGRGTDAASRASDALGASIARVGHYAAAAFAADRVLSMVGELGRAQQAAEALSQSLSYSAGSKSVSRELAYLAEVTNRLGVEYVSASKAYASFAAATKGTGISAEQARTIFEGVAQAAAKLGLSADDTSGALLALSQMAGKGVVSAEELRGQLGERIPGAFNLAARAMGVTTQELNKMLESGQIMASDFLPKFGALMKSEFIAPTNALTQEINRLSNAWENWKRTFANLSADPLNPLTRGLNESAAAMRLLGEEAGIVQRALVAIGGFSLGLGGNVQFDQSNVRTRLQASIAERAGELGGLEQKRQQNGGWLMLGEAARMQRLRKEIADLQREYSSLGVVIGGKIDLPNLGEQFRAQQEGIASASDAALKGFESRFATSAQRQQAKLLELTQAYSSAYKAISDEDPGASQKRAALLKQYNASLEELQKPKGGAPSESEQAREYRSALERLIDIQNSARAATEGLSAAQVVLNNAMQVPAGAMRDRLVQAAQQADAAQATQALAESLRNMDRAIIDAARGTMELDAAQTELYGLMTSPEWARMSEDERLRAVARTEEVSATLKLIEADRLLLEQRHKMRELADRYQGGGYGEVGSSDAMNAYSKDVGEALGNIPKANKEAADSFDDLKQSIEGWGRDSARAMVDFALTGKSSFKDMISSMLADLARMAVYRMITQPLFASISGYLPGGTPAATPAPGAAPVPSAKGNVFAEPGLQRFAKGGAFTNSIVSSPTLFRHADGLGEMGEAGPEAIMPLRRAQGRLGVIAETAQGETVLPLTRNAAGQLSVKADQLRETTQAVAQSPGLQRFAKGGAFADAPLPFPRAEDGRIALAQPHAGHVAGGNVSVVINNHSGAPVEQRSVPDGRGGRRLEVTIGEMVAAEMRRQGSAMNSATRSSFGLQPALVGR